MASLFTARRKARRIISQDSEENTASQITTDDAEVEDSSPRVQKPTTAPKARSRLRIAAVQDDDREDTSSSVQRPAKPSRLGSSALSQSILQRQREREQEERPSYSKSHLSELRNSTPNTPRDLSRYASSAEDETLPQDESLEVAAKFGSTSLAPPLHSSIPSSAQIAEVKSRRARLALEEAAAPGDGFISLEDYDSDGEFKPQRMQIGLYAHGRRGDSEAYEKEHTRLIREDEDIAEGFDDFVEDEGSNRVLMGKTGVRDLVKKERAKVRAMIDAAERGSDEDDDRGDSGSDSDVSLKQAYETAQTSHGLVYDSMSRRRREREARRPKQPEKTTSLSTLSEGLSRIRELAQQAELGRQRVELRKGEILRRQTEIEVEKERIQAGLRDLGEQLEKSKLNGTTGSDGYAERGLDNIGHG